MSWPMSGSNRCFLPSWRISAIAMIKSLLELDSFCSITLLNFWRKRGLSLGKKDSKGNHGSSLLSLIKYSSESKSSPLLHKYLSQRFWAVVNLPIPNTPYSVNPNDHYAVISQCERFSIRGLFRKFLYPFGLGKDTELILCDFLQYLESLFFYHAAFYKFRIVGLQI